MKEANVRNPFRLAGDPWTRAESYNYELEDHLENMLYEHPDLLPGVDSNAIVCRQFETGSGPIDLMIINAQNGAITLVECKLAKNPKVRRKVVGQIIDYAAAVRNMPFEDFRDKWISKAQKMLGAGEEFPLEEVAENLKLGRFTLVLAVDEINEPLKQMSLRDYFSRR